MFKCIRCSKEYFPPVYKTTLCAGCGTELKTCRHCKYFAPGKANDCCEPVSDPVLDKDKANFCDWFSPGQNLVSKDSDKEEKAYQARQAFSALFDDE